MGWLHRIGIRRREQLHQQGFDANSAWAFISSGFALGSIIYYFTFLFLDQKGAAIRYPTRFREYALGRKQQDAKETIRLLSKCNLLRHLPPEEVERILPCVRNRHLDGGEILFHAGDAGDALYIVAQGKVDVFVLAAPGEQLNGQVIGERLAELGEGQAFGEMALLSGEPRTATIQSAAQTDLLEISKEDFDRLVANDHQLATAVRRLSHERAIRNLSSGANPSQWARVAASNLEHLSRTEAEKALTEASQGAGMAIVLGNILDTIPGCLVIGAKFVGLKSLSITLIVGMFVGGIPEAAASCRTDA